MCILFNKKTSACSLFHTVISSVKEAQKMIGHTTEHLYKKNMIEIEIPMWRLIRSVRRQRARHWQYQPKNNLRLLN